MSLRKCLKRVAWVSFLPTGAILLLGVRMLDRQTQADPGFGFFHGFTSGRFTSMDGSFVINFKGQTKPEWKWARSSNHRYTDLSFEWDAPHTSGKGNLNLGTMELAQSEGLVTIDKNWFYRLTGDEVVAAAYLDLALSARDGTLPIPQHHWHEFDTPITGRLAHFSTGRSYPYSLLGWGLIWTAASIFFLISRARPISSQGDPAPLHSSTDTTYHPSEPSPPHPTQQGPNHSRQV